jgi:carbonic anhydrase
MRPHLIFIALAIAPATIEAQWTTEWSYEGVRGPAHWAALDPAYAACNGKEQSPIDIRSAEGAVLPALRFEYHSAPLKYLLNNGHAIRVNYHGSGDFLIAQGERYQLAQFHFHRPSEELIEGKRFAMVIHLMHESSGGKAAGVAVLLKAGSPNATIQQILDHLPAVAGPEHDVPGVEIDPAGLLPTNLAYYTYMGSQTAPPCTESVVWFVLKTPIEISPEQIAAFARVYPHNIRPVQPLNGRIVIQSR